MIGPGEEREPRVTTPSAWASRNCRASGASRRCGEQGRGTLSRKLGCQREVEQKRTGCLIERFRGMGVGMGHERGLGMAEGSAVRGCGQAAKQHAALERTEGGSLDWNL